ncbi:MAG: amidohydrolase family protein, partial [Dehalococcoidia bacterium]
MSVPEIDTIIRGGTVVTSSSAFEAAVAIKGETIVSVGPESALPPAKRVIDATGKYVLPGLIDVHTHFGGNDDWRIGPQAAAYGGLTTVINFIAAAPGDSLPQAIQRRVEEAERDSVVDFGFHFILRNDRQALRDVPRAVEMGVSTFKMFMAYPKWGSIWCPDDFIAEAMEIIGASGGMAQVHCESGLVIDYLEQRQIREERVHPRDFLASHPDWTEEESANRALKMAELTDCPVYVVHLSAHLALERIKASQASGQRAWTETCPQYLLLSDAEMERWGPLAKIGPPLRSADGLNQEAMWRGARDGYISCVASDHAPFAREQKEAGWQNIFFDAQGTTIPYGAPSVETMAPLMYSEGVVKRGFPITWMARVLSENPARLFGLFPRKGVIQPGADADLLIIDPKGEATIRAQDQHVTAGYTLYEDWKVSGRPVMSLLRGRVLLNDGQLELAPGAG